MNTNFRHARTFISSTFRLLAFGLAAAIATAIAADVSITMSMKVDGYDSKLQPSVTVRDLTVTMSGSAQTRVVQLISTNKVNLNLSAGHATLGWCYARNLDGTNYVSLGSDADAPFLELKAGEGNLFRVSRGVTNISAKANAAAVWIEAWVLED